jgi:replicative DNA helicase
MRHTTTLNEHPVPDTLSLEMQIIADIISAPECLMEAEKIIDSRVFTDERCRKAWETLKQMEKDGMTIDLPSAFVRMDRDMMQKGIIPLLGHTGGTATALQHCSSLKNLHLARHCYFSSLDMLMASATAGVKTEDLIAKAGQLHESLRKEMDAEKSMQHIAEVIDELGEQIGEKQRNKQLGKVTRIPTGFSCLDWLTYGGYERGDLVILAARPSVGKTAVMLQMARAAAVSGKAVNIFSLEMTNTQLAQRLLFSTERLTALQVARGEVEWREFEFARGEFADRPMYLNDSAHTYDELASHITLNSQAGKCDIAFIDYLGLISMGVGKAPLYQAIAEITKGLKRLAKSCQIPIVLLCQLNRASASEGRPPALYDLRDSGSIEQDADIVLMLEKAGYEEDGKDVNIWVRKNRQGKAGEVKIEITANDSYTAFYEKNGRGPEPIYNEFDNNDCPF